MENTTDMVIAIDGPSASGKSTVAKSIATRLGRLYVDSGALYRGLTWETLQRNLRPDVESDVEKVLAGAPLKFLVEDGAVRFRINGADPGIAIRSDIVNENVSLVAAMPAVRARVVAWLRSLVEFGELVMEGRDIGTAVFPDARHKFYLDASAEERARRRHAESSVVSEAKDISRVGASLRRRDERDRSRSLDPLKVAKDAVIIDSTTLSIDEVCEYILGEIDACSKID